jgi:hypothetical protein
VLHDKVGALVGRFTRAKAPGGALLGAMGPVEASGKVQRGDEVQPTVESRLERP